MRRDLNRRDWLVGSAAAAALAGCSGTPSIVPAPKPQPTSGTYDVVVIGAGPAGIAAARQVLAYGRSVLVLEAQHRLGGRAYTDNNTFSEVGFDLGAQFFGHCLAGNFLWGVAKAQGIRGLDFSTVPTYFFHGTKQATGAQALSFKTTVAGITTDLLTIGASIARASDDVPLSRVSNPYRHDPWYENAAGLVITTDTGFEPVTSTQDLFDFDLGSPAPFVTPRDSFIVKSGVGNFIASLGTGLPVTFGAQVTRITRNAGGVTVETSKATYRAKTAIVTVSTNVIGAIEFAPKLPAATTDAIAQIPCGHIYKAALGFNKQIFPSKIGTKFTAVTPLSKRPPITYFANFWGFNIVEFLADADLAKQIESLSRSGQIDYLLRRLEENVPGAAAAWDKRFTGSDWGVNPYFLGAYSAAKVGHAEARIALRKPVDSKIWFAGEAVAQTSTVTLIQGAYGAGVAAASAALKSIGVAVKHQNGDPVPAEIQTTSTP